MSQESRTFYTDVYLPGIEAADGNQALHSGASQSQTDLLKAKAPASIALHCFRHLRKVVERLYATT